MECGTTLPLSALYRVHGALTAGREAWKVNDADLDQFLTTVERKTAQQTSPRILGKSSVRNFQEPRE